MANILFGTISDNVLECFCVLCYSVAILGKQIPALMHMPVKYGSNVHPLSPLIHCRRKSELIAAFQMNTGRSQIYHRAIAEINHHLCFI